MNRFGKTLCAAGAVLLTLFGAGWLDKGYSSRIEIDVDTIRHTPGKPVLLTIDAVRFARATGIRLDDKKFTLGATLKDGKEQELAFCNSGVDAVDNKIRIQFIMPDGKVHLYCGGEGKVKNSPEVDIFKSGALKASKYKSDGYMTVSAIPGGVKLKQKKLANSRKSNIFAEQIIALDKEFAGMPVTLIFDGYNNSKAMWPCVVSVQALNAARRPVGEQVCDGRWTMIQAAPEKPFNIRQGGVIDHRAKYLRLRIGAARADEERKYDVFGKLLKNPSDALPDMDIKSLKLVPGYHVTLPGANDKLYTEGVQPGTSALKFAGRTAVMYNNFPSNVWSSSERIKDQSMFYWPMGKNGTAEFFVKFDEIPVKNVVLLDNARNSMASFLRLEYDKDGFMLKMNSYKVLKKRERKHKTDYSFSRKIKADLTPDKWIHLAVTWGENGVALFVDGKKIFSDSFVPAPAATVLKVQDREKNNPAEYTLLGADGHRYFDDYHNTSYNNYFKGAVDELRVSKCVRYDEDFTPQKSFTVDADTCALFSYEKNFDGISGIGTRHISGTIYAADVPPRADVITLENADGNVKTVRYVPEKVPASNIPQYFIAETSYPVLPTPEDFKSAKVHCRKSAVLGNNGVLKFTTPAHTVPEYIEIKALDHPVKAPMLRHAGEIDARSFADVVKSIDFSDAPDDHSKVRKLFDFLVRSTDYFTFSGAEFPKYSNKPMHAASNGLVAINSYTCFQCGPLNGIASGLFTNGLGKPSVLTFGNGHLFQQVMINGKLRVFDLSAQQYLPSRDQDDAASLDELEKDWYLFERTRRPITSVSHFVRMSRRGSHSVANAPKERLEYTLYPGESFRYYPANCGLSNDISTLTWNGKKPSNLADTWEDYSKQTGSAVTVGRIIQRPQPHTSQGIYLFNGKVSEGAFSNITSNGFCYRIDTPYTIISGFYRVPDKNASFELSYDKGRSYRKLESRNGVCHVEFALRGRHAALLKVKTSAKEFKAVTFTQVSPRRQTGQVRSGKNELIFTSDAGKAQVTAAYRTRAKEITFDGGFYFGVVPGLERQLFTLEPGKSRVITSKGLSPAAKVRASGGLEASLANGKLTVKAPSNIEKGVKYIIVNDNSAVKVLEFLVCKNVKEYSVKDLKPTPVRRERDKLVRRAADKERVQDCIKGNTKLDVSNVKPGKYVIFTLTRRDNRVDSVMQATIRNGKQELVGARIRNPGFEFYKATYGPYPARWANMTEKEKKISPWSRFRWDIATGKDTYPRISNVPLETVITSGNKPLNLYAHTDCAGVILLPSDDRFFMYQSARNLLNMSRCDWMFDDILSNLK